MNKVTLTEPTYVKEHSDLDRVVTAFILILPELINVDRFWILTTRENGTFKFRHVGQYFDGYQDTLALLVDSVFQNWDPHKDIDPDISESATEYLPLIFSVERDGTQIMPRERLAARHTLRQWLKDHNVANPESHIPKLSDDMELVEYE